MDAFTSKTQARIGWILSILTILFMVLDAGGKLALESHSVDATVKIGFPVGMIRPIGIIALLCTALYAIPRTAILGAVLLTGYYGGVARRATADDLPVSSVTGHPMAGVSWPAANFARLK